MTVSRSALRKRFPSRSGHERKWNVPVRQLYRQLWAWSPAAAARARETLRAKDELVHQLRRPNHRVTRRHAALRSLPPACAASIWGV
jgi:hypothetical protein